MSGAPSTLCPGYEQVDSFLSDDEYEDEEVIYVTLDMGEIEPTLVPTSSSYRLIGLDTPSPFLQLQGTILKGRHDLLLGTELIFTDDKESHDWSKRSVVHVANTEQRIAFQEVTLIPKTPSSAKGKERATDGEEDIKTDREGTSAQEVPAIQIERLTGLSAPVGRASRRSKATSGSKAPPRPKRRASAKARETDYDQLDAPPERDSSPGYDDMYMDT